MNLKIKKRLLLAFTGLAVSVLLAWLCYEQKLIGVMYLVAAIMFAMATTLIIGIGDLFFKTTDYKIPSFISIVLIDL